MCEIVFTSESRLTIKVLQYCMMMSGGHLRFTCENLRRPVIVIVCIFSVSLNFSVTCTKCNLTKGEDLPDEYNE
jgi:hypothetical protein